MTSVEVVGHHRGSHRYVKMIVPHEWLTHFQAELIYSPYIISLLPTSRLDIHDESVSGPEAKARIEEAIAHLISLSDTMR